MSFDGKATETRPTATTRSPLSLLVRMSDGSVLSPPAMVGDRLTDVVARCGISIRTGDYPRGGEPCALFKRPCADRLPLPHPGEKALLATGGVQDGTSRLLSHIVLTLDGPELEPPWHALVPQTYWVAGSAP